MYRKFILAILLINFVLFTSCSQNNDLNNHEETTIEEQQPAKVKFKDAHSYGGWFCPDNFGGFPPVDIQDLDKIPVVNGRLPTKEETQNGTSLMYFDFPLIQDAKALDMVMPKLARHYSKHNEINELVIVIQAVVIGNDTVVGFRYPNGGNGSAWFSEVSFLEDEEVNELKPSPFVYFDTEINASKEKIWKAIASTSYAKKLGDKFDKKDFFSSEWTADSQAHLNFESDNVRATGIITTLWGNLYLHIDYDKKDFHFAEKLLLIENRESDNAQLHIVAGPFPENFKAQQKIWKNWLQEVKNLSEMD